MTRRRPCSRSPVCLPKVIGQVVALVMAQRALTSDDGRWGPADPLPRRFDAAGITALVEGAGLAVADLHGVRIFSDLVPAAYIDSDTERAALLELEQTASRHPDYAFLGHIGAALHVMARRG